MSETVIQNETGSPYPSPKRGKWIALGVAVIVVLGLGTAFVVEASSGAPAIPPTDIYKVAAQTAVANIQTTGTVVSSSQSNLAFQNVGGTIKTINVDVGAHVKAGQVLATLDDSTIQAQIMQAEAGVAEAQGNVAEAQARLDLATEGPTSSTISVAQSAVESAKVALANAEKGYQDAINVYNDRTAQKAQLVAAQTNVANLKTAYDNAQTNEQAQTASIQAALTSAETTLQNDTATLQKDEAQYGSITAAEVQQDYQAYQSALSHYQSWQNGGFAGTNPYQQELDSTQQVYQSNQQGYQTLQGDENTVKADQSQVAQLKAQLTQVQTGVQQAQTQYQAAEQQLQVAEQSYNDRTDQQNAVNEAANQVKQEQAAVQSAEANLQAVMNPQVPGNIQTAQAGVQTAQAGVTSAEAQLKTAELDDSYTVLRAPANGIITQKNDAVGDVVAPGQPVFQMDVNQLQVYVAVSESQLENVSMGDTVQMSISAIPGRTFTGKIFEIDPTPIQGAGMNEYRVKATLENTGNLVKPGMNGTVTIQTNDKHSGLTIPAMSLQQINGVYGVYLVGQKPTTTADLQAGVSSMIEKNLPKGVYFQPVSVGFMDASQVQVTSGLKPGDEILLGEGRFMVSPNGQEMSDANQ